MIDTYAIESFDAYMNEAKSHDLLTAQEEITLIAAAQQGNESARNRVITCNLLLVVSIARRYCREGVALADLVQEGNLGLIRAVGKFDTTKGWRFTTYATWWIRQAIARYVGEYQHLIRVPSYIATDLHRFRRAQQTLEGTDSPVTVATIAAYLGMEESHVVGLARLAQSVISIDEPLDGHDHRGEALFLADTLAAEDDTLDTTTERLYLQEQVRRVLAIPHILKARERQVIELRFGIGRERGMTLGEIGKELQVSRERARQNEAAALRKLAPYLAHLRDERDKEEVSA